jgi:hypothetical protein
VSCGFTPGGTCFADRTIIRRNRMVGYLGVNMRIDETRNALIENNLIIAATNTSDNIIDVARTNTCTGTCYQTGTTIRNNTIYNTGSDAGAAISIDGQRSGTNYVVTGNAILDAASMAYCFNYGASGINYWDYNLCSGPATWEAGRTLAQWQGLGHDVHSSAAAPQFTSTVAPYDFTPAVGSPLVNAGTTAASCTVLGGVNQPCSSPTAMGTVLWDSSDVGIARSTQDAQPDIGAFER